MNKEATNKQITYQEKYKDMKVDGSRVLDSLQIKDSNIFMTERGLCKINEKVKEYIILKVYFDIKDTEC